MKRILRIREVQSVTGLSRSTIYRKLATKEFPPQVHMGSQTVGWREADIEEWMAGLPTDKPSTAKSKQNVQELQNEQG